MHKSKRCSYCENLWPYEERFEICPICREDTELSMQAPLGEAIANELAAHGEFGWYLWDNGRV